MKEDQINIAEMKDWERKEEVPGCFAVPFFTGNRHHHACGSVLRGTCAGPGWSASVRGPWSGCFRTRAPRTRAGLSTLSLAPTRPHEYLSGHFIMSTHIRLAHVHVLQLWQGFLGPGSSTCKAASSAVAWSRRLRGLPRAQGRPPLYSVDFKQRTRLAFFSASLRLNKPT